MALRNKTLLASRSISDFSRYNTDVLSIRDTVYLFALLTAHKDEGFCDINSFNHLRWASLAPTIKYAHKIITHLNNKNLINAKHPYFDDIDKACNEYSGKCIYQQGATWDLKVDNQYLSIEDIMERLEYKLSEANFSHTETEQLNDLVNELMAEECIAYMHVCAEREELDFNLGTEIKKAILFGLERYSIAQMYNFIWKSVDASSGEEQPGKFTRQSAADNIIKNIKGFYYKVESENLKVKLYKQDDDYKESVLNEIVFSMTLKCQDRWFNTRINKPV